MKKVVLLLLGVFLLSTQYVKCEDDAEEASDETADGEAREDLEDLVIENDVVILTEDNFDRALETYEYLLVEFYAPWCGHCKRLQPEYEKAAEILDKNEPRVVLAKVDATGETKLAEKYGVSGYPTLKWFKQGQIFDFDGPRDADGIVAYMKQRSDPSWKPPPEAVITLTKANFSDVVDTSELILVEFYAPWCEHCQRLAPVYEAAAKVLQRENPPIPLAKVDAHAEKELAGINDIKSYPTLRVFKYGKRFRYEGGLDKHAIINYMTQQQGPPSTELRSLAEVRDRMKTDDVTVIGFFKNRNDKAYTIYENAVNDLREDYELGHVFHAEIRLHYKINAPALVVFNAENFYTKYEPKFHVMELTDETTKEMIHQFIDDHKVPLVGQYKSTTKDNRYSGKRPLLLMFYTVDFSFDHREATQLWRRKLADIAKDFSDMTFAIVNEDDYSELIKNFGFDESPEEINIGILDEKEKKYPMPVFDSFDSDEIRDFIKSFQKGKIKPKIRSQPVPKKTKTAVKTVVGTTFEKIVFDKTKDVLVEFYAPWCGHCKKFAPEYTQLAKEFLKTEKNLVITKFDATANDYPDSYKVSGFPTIYFAPANSDKTSPIKYEGDRGHDDIVDFLKKHATASFKSKDEL